MHDELHHLLGEMDACDLGGEAPHTELLHLATEDMEIELDLHATNMAAATDLSAAWADEARHQAELATTLTALRTTYDELATEAEDYLCAAHGAQDETAAHDGH